MEIQRVRFEVRGQVQGVGFRPYVHRLAHQLALGGFVANDRRGAVIEVQGPAPTIEHFAKTLLEQLPPLADVTDLRRRSLPPTVQDGFEIRHSRYDGQAQARVTADASVCSACLAEMRDPRDRRYQYPFINCTDCGPRYSIVQRIPYDRPNTTMHEFAMCSACRGEYTDPGSRRFHAQPIACPACGPRVWLTDPTGSELPAPDPIGQARDRLRAGQILAIKGLGGFHLACRADRDEPVAELRRRKRRDCKPFALMVADLQTADAIAHVDDPARQLLTGIERPIVLLPKRRAAPISPLVAPGSNCFGLMLPYTPLHWRLLDGSMPPLVMTSGNTTDEPLAKDNDEALQRLAGLCDAFLMHNRNIERRLDDSVVQADHHPVLLRRSRGYVPRPVRLPAPAAQPILAVGAEGKNTICLVRDRDAVLSEHIGDLTDATVYRQFLHTIEHLAGLVQVAPQIVVHDLHPQYLSTHYARRQRALPTLAIQHHWAHALSCMAEHGLQGPVIAIVCDGTGYGTDGAAWGCEILQADYHRFTRLGHLQYFPLPGADAAAKQLHRSALGLLYHTFGPSCADLEVTQTICPDPLQRAALLQMLRTAANCPPTSSLGRLFDAVACMLGLAQINHFEGQAPMALEAVAAEHCDEYYPHAVEHHGRTFELDVRPLISAITAEVRMNRDPALVSARFHNTLVELLKAAALIAKDITDLNDVVLSGGCFVNRYLRTRLCRRLDQAGIRVWTHRQIPCNDGGIALGQAAAAAAMLPRPSPRAAAAARKEKHVLGRARTG